MSKSLVQQQFGAHAAAYTGSPVHAKGASLTRLVDLIHLQPTWRALDIAAGPGHTAYAIAPHVAHVTVSDLTPAMLDEARALAAAKGIANVSFQEADAEELPFAAASFDLVTCRIAPHHFSHVDRFIAQSWRVLRPGGVLVVVDNVVPTDESAAAWINQVEIARDPSHVRALSLEEWRGLLTTGGFLVVNSEVAPKEMEFQPWAERMGASPAVIAGLRRLITTGPPPVTGYFRPRLQDDMLWFTLWEAIVVAHKPPV